MALEIFRGELKRLKVHNPTNSVSEEDKKLVFSKMEVEESGKVEKGKGLGEELSTG